MCAMHRLTIHRIVKCFSCTFCIWSKLEHTIFWTLPKSKLKWNSQPHRHKIQSLLSFSWHLQQCKRETKKSSTSQSIEEKTTNEFIAIQPAQLNYIQQFPFQTRSIIQSVMDVCVWVLKHIESHTSQSQLMDSIWNFDIRNIHRY